MSIINSILESLNRDVLNQLDLTKSIRHPGENGRAREKIITEYLRRLVPKEFGIDTGFVFDAQESISKQIDIVVYRRSYHPVFEIGGIKHFMVESVAAVIENKAFINSAEILNSALENIKSAKVLDRTNNGQNYLLNGTNKGDPVEADKFEHQIFGAIVTESSLTESYFQKTLFEFFQKDPNRRNWLNWYADVRGFSASFLRSDEQGDESTVKAMEAKRIFITKTGVANYKPPLLELSFELINFLRVAPIIDYMPTAYLGGQGGEIKWWKLP